MHCYVCEHCKTAKNLQLVECNTKWPEFEAYQLNSLTKGREIPAQCIRVDDTAACLPKIDGIDFCKVLQFFNQDSACEVCDSENGCNYPQPVNEADLEINSDETEE